MHFSEAYGIMRYMICISVNITHDFERLICTRFFASVRISHLQSHSSREYLVHRVFAQCIRAGNGAGRMVVTHGPTHEAVEFRDAFFREPSIFKAF